MPQRILKYRIRQDGLVEETVDGAQGDSCHGLTKNLEEALGTVERKELTAEGYISSVEQSELVSAKLI